MKQWIPNELLKKCYEEKFNFYFSKPIKEIMAGCSVRHAILLKDWQFYDRNEEFVKKFYSKLESYLSLRKNQEIKQNPKLVLHRQSEIIEKRYRKLNKLNDVGPIQIIGKKKNESFQTSEHDIYNNSRFRRCQKEAANVLKQINFKFEVLKSEKIFELDSMSEMDKVFEEFQLNMNKKIVKLAKNEKINYPLEKFVKKTQISQVKKLNLHQLSHGGILQLMNKFAKFTKSCQSNGYLTERGKEKKTHCQQNSFSPSLINLNQLRIKNNYQLQNKKIKQSNGVKWSESRQSDMSDQQQKINEYGQNYNKKVVENSSTFEQTMKKPNDVIGESEKLLNMLRFQNVSHRTSPHRKLEIKLNLNKLIQEQSISNCSFGFWTSRNSKVIPQGSVISNQTLSTHNKSKPSKRKQINPKYF